MGRTRPPLPGPSTSRKQRRISVVVISRNEGASLRSTVENLEDTLPPSGDVLVIDDGSTDGSAAFLARRRGRVRLIRQRGIGVTKARNLGARSCRGDVIVFADAHITLAPFWWRPLLELLEDPRVGAAAPAISRLDIPHKAGYGLTFRGPGLDVRWLRRKYRAPVAAPILPGCCVAMRRDVFEATGGWDEGLLQRGNVDNECGVRLWLLGYELMVTSETVVGHLFRRRSPYPVGWPQFLQNRLRLAFVHFKPPRLSKVVGALRKAPLFGQAFLMLSEGGVAARRREMFAKRVRNDDWFFDRFGLKW